MCVVRTPHEQGRSENCERDTSRLGQKYLAIFLLGVSNSFLSQSRCSQTLPCETKEATPTLRGWLSPRETHELCTNSVLSLCRWYKSESASLLYGQGGRENKSWSCGAASVALNTYRGERSPATDRVKLQDRSGRRIAPAEKHRGN